MKTQLGLFAVAAASLLWSLSCTAAEPDTPAGASPRIGIYDSRSVVIAYMGSEVQRKEMEGVRSDYEKAKGGGNAEEMKRIEAQMRASQTLRHKQGFSTAPVDDVLRHIQPALARIKAEAGVSALVSKWDEAELAKYKGAARVDVTMKLVEEFHPSERQLKSAIDIQKHQPIPLAQAENIKD